METFWYWLTEVHLENGRQNGQRELGTLLFNGPFFPGSPPLICEMSILGSV